jgi:hypothetical protein
MINRILLILLAALNLYAADYVPNIGIPNPKGYLGFDINIPIPDFPPEWLEVTTTPVVGYYYVDNSNPSSTDVANPWGHPQMPRKKLPEGNLTGTIMLYVAGGTYTAIDSGGDRYDWYGIGSAAQPIWITGNPDARPTIREQIHIGDFGSTSHLIFANFKFNNSTVSRINVKSSIDGDMQENILIRDIELIGTLNNSNAKGAVTIGYSQGMPNPRPLSWHNNVVTYRCVIKDFGITADNCGHVKGYNTRNTWVLSNDISNCAADGVAGSHYSNYDTAQAINYYVGGNFLHGNGENGMDFKAMQGAVISQNTITGPVRREGGGAIVAHSGSSPPYRCRDFSFLYNRIYDMAGGIVTTEGYGVNGVAISDIRPPMTIEIKHNIIANMRPYSLTNTFQMFAIYFTSDSATGHLYSTIDYNSYDASVNSFRVANTVRTLAEFRSVYGFDLNSLTVPHGMVDPANGDFSLSDTSPLIDAGGTVLPKGYQSTFLISGENIQYDLDGDFKPQGAALDIGFDEYNQATVEVVPDAPAAPTLTQSHGKIQVSWLPIANASGGYKVWISLNDIDYTEYRAVVTGITTTEINVPNLVRHYFKVSAINSQGSSSLSPPAYIHALPHRANNKPRK